jgi:FlaA1/EpsC-like NDP-sugar epimerase
VIRQSGMWLTRSYLADLGLAGLGAWLGVYMSAGLGAQAPDKSATQTLVAAFVLSVMVCLPLFRATQTVWRWTSADDLLRLAQAVAMAGMGSVSILFIANMINFIPRVSLIFVPVMALVLMVGARGLLRTLAGTGIKALFRTIAPDAPATILVGPTEAVTRAVHMARQQGALPFRPIAIVSTLGNQIGKVFAGARVYGGLGSLEALVRDAKKTNAQVRIALVGDDPERKAAQAALMISSRTEVQLMRVPDGTSGSMNPVHPADVLGRPRRQLDMRGPRNLIRFKRVLVTGAGGTIGSELVRQLAKLGPSKVILVDSSESNLYQIDLEMRSQFPALEVIPRLCDIRNKDRITEIFKMHSPHVVFHAAANKHVPLMEAHVCEALEVNLGGTKVVADAALETNVQSFIFISTDKAVNPSNVMGAAKRAAELYVGLCAAQSDAAFHSVRFGNVLGSNGSVMPLFEGQIAQGGPVTVTHSEMTRWFMTVEEASALVLQAAAVGSDSSAQIKEGQFVLDMGDPVRIIDLAEAMIRMKGKEPRRDIDIVEVGLRPGEKLHEELFYAQEQVVHTPVDGVMVARDSQPLDETQIKNIELTIAYAAANDGEAALAALQVVVPSFKRAD